MLAQAAMLAPMRMLLEPQSVDAATKTYKYWLSCLIFFAGGVITCSLDYPTSAALPATSIILLVWIFFFQKKIWRSRGEFLAFGALGLCLGGALTLLAPGNARRVSLTDDVNVQVWQNSTWIERILSWLEHLPLAFLWDYVPLLFLLWGCWILHKRFGRSWLIHIPLAAWLFLLPALLTVGAFLFTSWPPSRAFATISAQMIVCASIVYVAASKAATCAMRKFFRYVRLIFFIICALSLCLEASRFHDLHEAVVERENILRSGKGGPVYLDALPVKSSSYQSLGGALNDISEDPSFWVNRAMSAFYGVEKIIKKTPGDYGCQIAPSPEGKLRDLENLNIKIVKGKIELSVPDHAKPHYNGMLHFYYQGYPGLSSYLPAFMDNALFNWLAAKDDWRKKLIPVFLARTDIDFQPEKKPIVLSRPLKIENREKIWAVKPGDSAYSFDLIPIGCLLIE